MSPFWFFVAVVIVVDLFWSEFFACATKRTSRNNRAIILSLAIKSVYVFVGELQYEKA